MSAPDIARSLGATQSACGWWRASCPVHGSSRASLVFRDGARGLIVHCHAGCPRPDILDELRRLGLIAHEAGATDLRPDVAEIARRRDAEARDRRRRIALARDIIDSALPAPGTPVERYLQARIPGITRMPAVIGYISMRDRYAWHPHAGCQRPVMVVAVEHVGRGLVGAHRTWLAVDGSAKASLDPVRISTGPIKGGAVRLAPTADTLMVGEGIETCLAAMTATAVPAWAALSAGGIEALILPPNVRTVIILADNDANGTGERAARTAAARWITEGRRVRIAMPPEPGTDFNDVLLGRSYGRIVEARDVAA
jgi:putative DNA primase/helicase